MSAREVQTMQINYENGKYCLLRLIRHRVLQFQLRRFQLRRCGSLRPRQTFFIVWQIHYCSQYGQYCKWIISMQWWGVIKTCVNRKCCEYKKWVCTNRTGYLQRESLAVWLNQYLAVYLWLWYLYYVARTYLLFLDNGNCAVFYKHHSVVNYGLPWQGTNPITI